MVVSVDGVKINENQIDGLAQKAFEFAKSDSKMKGEVDKEKLTYNKIRTVLKNWVVSRPHEFKFTGGLKLGSIWPTLGFKSKEPKAWWKGFKSEDDFKKQLCYESNSRVLKNRNKELELANKILEHTSTAKVLNELRRALGSIFWDRDGRAGILSHYFSTYTPLNLFPNWTGSYNEANSYPDYKEYREDEGVLSLKLGQSIWKYPTRSKDRLSLMFDKRNFTVSENIAILHDIKELFSPRGNSRLFPTWHSQIVPHPYQGKQSPDKPRRWECTKKGLHRVDVLKKNGIPKEKDDVNTEIKWDQGRLGAGTRNEKSPDTITARNHFMPIETGRSHTAARLFEMVCLLKPSKNASKSEWVLFEQRMRAMAFGIFGYWNGSNGYPKMLTPVHTYHEVMDPAEDYLSGIYDNPFTYKDIEGYLDKGCESDSANAVSSDPVNEWETFIEHLKKYKNTRSFPNPENENAAYAVKAFLGQLDFGEPAWKKSTSDKIRELNGDVRWTSNQGWYRESKSSGKGSILKELNYGHIASDCLESTRLRITADHVRYDGYYEFMYILPKHGDENKLLGANGFPLPTGSYMFTIGEDGRLRYFPTDDGYAEGGHKLKHFAQYLPHAALAKRESVYAAGNFGVEEGELKWVSSTSGHYRVNDKMCCHNFFATISALRYEYEEKLFLSYSDAKRKFADLKKGKSILHDTRPKQTQLTKIILKALEEIKLTVPRRR
ncbi:hypothetical protein [Microbulbifer sp. VAAF005]|uniref:hypothetical protein n=1 Tax=Microbulbifer sp. VAAF005 TaxID=3034230 RepID=UPI0024ADF9A3|nr:hypothetical protein [Microbulbifer sp. VAAF005]WHI48435.1 hypothetical protein P0078_08700 [Microbulbifer sp. VAAF005]